MFRWLGEPLAVDLANTVMVVRDGEEIDLLADREELRRWLDAERDRLGDCAFAITRKDQLLALRDAMRRVFIAAAHHDRPSRDAVDHINTASAAVPVAPQLTVDGTALTLTEQVERGEAMAELLGRLARSAIIVLTDPELGPLQVCNAPSCGMFYLGTRRWCCAACGNRARAARHYQRARTAATGG